MIFPAFYRFVHCALNAINHTYTTIANRRRSIVIWITFDVVFVHSYNAYNIYTRIPYNNNRYIQVYFICVYITFLELHASRHTFHKTYTFIQVQRQSAAQRGTEVLACACVRTTPRVRCFYLFIFFFKNVFLFYTHTLLYVSQV